MNAEEILDKCQHPYDSSIRMEDRYVNRDAALNAMRKYYNKALDDVRILSKLKFIQGESGYINEDDIKAMEQ